MKISIKIILFIIVFFLLHTLNNFLGLQGLARLLAASIEWFIVFVIYRRYIDNMMSDPDENEDK